MFNSVTATLRTLREITNHPLNRHDRLAAVSRYLGWNLGRRLLDAEYVLPLAGDAEIILSNAENYATLAYTEGLWDYADMLFLLHFLRPGDLFVDVGANVGAYTVLAGRVARGWSRSSPCRRPMPSCAATCASTTSRGARSRP